MLTEPLYQGLQDLGLRGMARQFRAQEKGTSQDLSFAERLALLIDAERSERGNYRYAQRLRWAKLGQSASLEDIDSRTPRGLDRAMTAQLGTLKFVADKLNVLITGPTGVDKSYLACALGQHACRENISVRYLRLPRLVEELVRADALKKKSQLFKHLAKFQLLILDDFGLTPLADDSASCLRADFREVKNMLQEPRTSTRIAKCLHVDRPRPIRRGALALR
jgi:DNA replication protein DnaC